MIKCKLDTHTDLFFFSLFRNRDDPYVRGWLARFRRPHTQRRPMNFRVFDDLINGVWIEPAQLSIQDHIDFPDSWIAAFGRSRAPAKY